MSRERSTGLTYVNTRPSTGPTAGPTTTRQVTCDLGALPAPDLAVVDALARLRLAAARQGVGLSLRNASGPLRELLAFSGLAAVLPTQAPTDAPGTTEATEAVTATAPPGDLPFLVPARLPGPIPEPQPGQLTDLPPWLPPDLPADLLTGLQPGRQAEQREERVGVEEVGEPRDPAR
ncbi:STAS domain-containing protein [Kitasatospora sp. NPDC002965]|uniref:STAS domain-containing protein n=1 Tax=Kitasatospora sp. NPDC002965 TaxID=3154775 RepID=UPI0033A2B2B8